MIPDEPDPHSPRRATFRVSLRHGMYLLIEKLLRWCINPRFRARLLRLLGAKIGSNVRVYEVQLFNLEEGFRNLQLGDNVHVGPGCHLDLTGRLTIGARSTLSPAVTILTHADPGASHGSRIALFYPPRTAAVSIGNDCWLGASVTVLAGCTIHDCVVIGAGSVVTHDAPSGYLVAGVPARTKSALTLGGNIKP
jgi:acetyltransferase-like isoleucine patch superfamily enzyme